MVFHCRPLTGNEKNIYSLRSLRILREIVFVFFVLKGQIIYKAGFPLKNAAGMTVQDA
jgi:hypothetical protein